MRIGIHQPMYLPWAGLFDRISRCDQFVLLDNVAYSKNYLINRNKIKTAGGWIWLTVPVLMKGNFGQLIKDVHINNAINWRNDHWQSIYHAYKKAPYFSDYAGFFEKMYQTEWTYLVDLIEASLCYLLESIKVDTPVKKASELKAAGKKEELLVNICTDVKADEYLSGPAGRDYLDLKTWKGKKINVTFHDYRYPQHSQLHGDFVPAMSVLDVLFNHGQESLRIITEGQNLPSQEGIALKKV